MESNLEKIELFFPLLRALSAQNWPPIYIQSAFHVIQTVWGLKFIISAENLGSFLARRPEQFIWGCDKRLLI